MSLAGGVAMLLWKNTIVKWISELTSFAAGVLITIAILDLLPEAFELGDGRTVSIAVMIGVIFLFLLEKTSVWFHHHHEPHGKAPAIAGVFMGDTLHNFIDGIAIGAAFLIDVPAGIATAIAVGMHELPQEIADFMLYIKAGYSRRRTLTLNILSSFATVVGAMGVLIFGDVLHGIEVYILALTAGMFLYIGLADLLPEMHGHGKGGHLKGELFAFFGGIVAVTITMSLLG